MSCVSRTSSSDRAASKASSMRSASDTAVRESSSSDSMVVEAETSGGRFLSARSAAIDPLQRQRILAQMQVRIRQPRHYNSPLKVFHLRSGSEFFYQFFPLTNG